jgi:B-box zinc finger
MNCANHPDRERVAFCQNCGKPLCQECTRTVGSAVFCEPCLAAKLAGSGTPPSAGTGYTYTGPAGDANFTATGTIPPPPVQGEPNPGLAALLGFIPGVGAMYNGQYAKGIVHLIVFAVLVSLANENGIFGLFVAGWIFYQVIEAHHTARARRDGTPLPNPFGLNDLGERLGFGKAWPITATQPAAGPPDQPVAPAGTYAPPPAGTYAPPVSAYAPPPGSPPPSAATWGAPTDHWESFVPPQQPPIPPYGVGIYPPPPNAPYPRNRFPAGAIWLIALGAVFLIGNAGIFHGFPVDRLLPFFLIGLGVWLFVHKMTDTGTGLADDGTPAYRLRLFRALRGSVWVVLIGVMFFLAAFHILSWGHSWPLFIIVAGLMTIFERTAYSSAVAATYPYQPQPPVAPPATSSTSIVPSPQNDQEGR